MPVATVKYDLEKVQLACLELLGWRHWHWSNWSDGAGTFTEPGVGRETKYSMFEHADHGETQFAPDPTDSLDDALPLMEKYTVDLLRSHGMDDKFKWMATTLKGNDAFNDSATLAVCLCSLRCAGRDLKEFELP